MGRTPDGACHGEREGANGNSPMDLVKMIAELQAERQRIDEAIQALERLSAGKVRRRGRPPSWLKDEMQRQGPNSEDQESSLPPRGKKG
jgi:hypothetical protein